MDGDGSITARIAPQGAGAHFAPSFIPIVGFYNQDLAVLEDIRETLGTGRITAWASGHSGCYRLMIPMRQVPRVLEVLLPYLRVKAKQAELVLVGLKAKSIGSSRVSEETQALRKALAQQIQDLNHSNGKAYRTKWVNSVDTSSEAIPSQAPTANVIGEGVTTREVSANNNLLHEDPPRKGLYSLTSTVM